MARQRKASSQSHQSKTGDSSSHVRNGNSSSSGTSAAQARQANGQLKKRVLLSPWMMIIGSCCLGIACYFGYVGYLETRVNTPFDDQKMVRRSGLSDPDRYWGSYRPGTYFGMKTRDPHSLVMGLMWYSPSRLGPGGDGIRHWCELSDRMDQYGWVQHDGRTFGVQEIHDGPLKLETSFVKYSGGSFGGDWTARVSVASESMHSEEEVSIIWYTALDEKTGGWITPDRTDLLAGIRGDTPGLGEFSLSLHETNGTVLHKSYVSTVAMSLQYLREAITSNLRISHSHELQRKFISLAGEVLRTNTGSVVEPNFIAHQLTVRLPFTLDIVYHSEEMPSQALGGPPVGEVYLEALNAKRREFSERFEKTFHLQNKGYSAKEIRFAEAALSNMLGGIGYFYGSSRVQSVHTKEPVPYWKAPLYTAVPSRSFFPRGFLWDEGFHGLLISTWDVDISIDIVAHWFSLMNVEGWIPREQILGVEALAKVPEEFVTQRNTDANPPTILLLLNRILTRSGNNLNTKERLATLDRLFPRLQAWFTWFNTTQRGDSMGTYRWRGRTENSVRELNPKTLTSGLDDYPRASHPSDRERHVDLRCWIAFAAKVMGDLARLVGRDDTKYLETYFYLSDNALLNEHHLSPYTETYTDWGLHTDSVVLKRPPVKPAAHGKPPQQQEMVRVTNKAPELRYIDSTFGYVSLFPLLLEILTADSPYLGKMLKDMRDPNGMWSDYGLRSLSKMSPLYMKRNTEHDPPYWRGAVWMNINYLALKALHHYGSQPGPHSELARSVYVELRHNLVSNVIKQYQRSGYLWEQYSDKTGEGSGCYPFTGWSALTVLIMAEQY
ncbi:mannosyl-oligosaccharide glucosidase isoform X2 [Phlebotomus argentipes]|uniref:mannosyl-oligosaccharide glucosidase isoform X2 n=1 Tax=Phlebotomus argentipes TaxID=94469 RepID=UPI002892F105|nr:mannosyl-oligosaccharide glucosidase isoform X2 [Phlebotomus argentipes]